MLFNYLPPTKTIVQHNQLVTGRYNMQLNELRIFTYMLLQIKKDDQEFREVQVPCQVVCGHQAKIHYEQIRETCKSLSKKVIHIDDVNKKGKRITINIPLFAISMYEEGKGYARARFNDEAKPYLLNLTRDFTSAQFNQLMQVNSSFGYRVYWLLKQYSDFGQRSFELEELKGMLMLENKYPNFSNFRRRVLEPAQRELAGTDMQFEYRPIKRGRSVHKLHFTFANKLSGKAKKTRPKKNPTLSHQPSQLQMDLSESTAPTTREKNYRVMLKFGLAQKQAQQYLQAIDESRLYRLLYSFDCAPSGKEEPKRYKDMLVEALNSAASQTQPG